MYETKIFDLDDTLVETSAAYRLGAAHVEEAVRVALPAVPSAEFQAVMDTHNLARLKTFGPDPAHMTDTYLDTVRTLAARHGRGNLALMERAARHAGQVVLHWRYLPRPGVHEMLGAYRAAGHRLACWTKGIESFQHQKLVDAELLSYFDIVSIVPVKAPEGLADVVHRVGGDRILMVGDSLRDDVGNAAALELDSALVALRGAPTWTYDQGVMTRPTHVLQTVLDLVTVSPPGAFRAHEGPRDTKPRASRVT